MPANIAHILIAQKASERFTVDNKDLGDLITSLNQFFYLGSIGPDLPSYKTSELVKAALNSLLVRPFISETNPREQDASFFLHSIHPHLFPYYLMEMNKSYCKLSEHKLVSERFNEAVYVFTLGYVTHIAADQVVHQLVRELVGPYYRSLKVSQAHSDCEVHQDIFLFKKLMNRKWNKTFSFDTINIKRFELLGEYDSFCNLIALAIGKAGYESIDKNAIDGWLDGIQTTFRLMYDIGPYATVIDSIESESDMSKHPGYSKYFVGNGFDYMKYYHNAIELSVKYMAAIKNLWDTDVYSSDVLRSYQDIVQPYDLTSPYFPL